MSGPYYDDGQVAIWHGDWRDHAASLGALDVLVSDVPYGIDYRSGRPRRAGNARSIDGDADTTERDALLEVWGDVRPALIFGTWRRPRPASTRMVLVWDKGGALGSGDLSLPWKPDHEEVYVLGSGFVGTRDCGSVLRFPPVQAVGRLHPHQKPVDLMAALIAKTDGVVLDPFAGSGSTLVAAKSLGRRAVGIEVEERYCEIAAERVGGPVRALPGSLFDAEAPA